LGVGVPPAGCGELGEPGGVVFVAACPSGDEGRAGEQVTLVVVAGPVRQDEVLHGIDAAADAGNEVICLRPGAERSQAVEAAVRLQWLGGNQPVSSEQVTVESQLSLRHSVDLCDHSRPVDLDQGTDQGAKPDQFVAGAGT
jgi:hypothetical protein